MDKDKIAVNTTETAAPQTEVVAVDDNEAKIAALEAEKNQLVVENANWKVAALKYKNGENQEDDEERMTRIAQKALSDSRLAEIAREQQAIITKALKENRELKLAHLNKTPVVPAAQGTHSEATPVRDTLVTQEQLAAFKAKGWSDKDIERYKKNLQRYSGR